jgi:hypothetical protein
VFRGRGAHPVRVRGNGIVRDRSGRPHLLWQTGLTDGSGFDLSGFTVEASHVDFRLAGSPVRNRVQIARPPAASMSRTARLANTIADPSGAPGPG